MVTYSNPNSCISCIINTPITINEKNIRDLSIYRIRRIGYSFHSSITTFKVTVNLSCNLNYFDIMPLYLFTLNLIGLENFTSKLTKYKYECATNWMIGQIWSPMVGSFASCLIMFCFIIILYYFF